MKEFLGWIRWSFAGMETWKRWFIFAIVLNISSGFFPDPYHWYVNFAGIGIVVVYLLKWFVWDQIVASWNKYKQHRNELFSTIKTSDVKE